MNHRTLLLVGALTAGLAVALWAFLMLRIIFRDRRVAATSWEFEARRKMALCDGSATFRWFAPLVEELASRKIASARLQKIKSQLVTSFNPLPWLPEEYLATKQLEALTFSAMGFGLGATLGGVLLGLIFGAVATFGFMHLALRDLAARAARRSATIKQRLPFAVDLVALMLESGASLMDGLSTLTADLRGHPLGDELGLVVAEVNVGRSVHESLTRLQDRIPDSDVAELVFTINKGEEFGTPMALTFRTQAEQMRLKRSQWAEKASAAAQVAIVLPGMLIMIACLLIICAPFLLSALEI